MKTIRHPRPDPSGHRPAAAGGVVATGGIAADALRRASVLIVDDEPDNVRLLERVLQAAGVGEIHTTCDPRDAVRLALETGADLVLLDLHMPYLDGFCVMRELRETLPDDAFLPVLVLTADVTPSTRDRALTAGAKDLLHKPFEVSEVVLRVRNLLETRALYETVQAHNAALQRELDERAAHERRIATELDERRARIHSVLAGAAFSVVHQPIADLRTGEVIGAEALARFARSPQRPPNLWFDEARAVGLGAELELLAIRTALPDLVHLPAGSFLSVNLSPETAVHPGLAEALDGHDGSRIVLELTEHEMVTDYRPLVAAFERIRGRGVRIAVDDTGAGYAGLRHLLHLRPEIIKLDIGLTSGIDLDPAKHALSAALVTFAADVGATIVAEGIETQGELAALRQLDIPWGQGYLLARPAPGPVDPVVPLDRSE